MKLLVGKSQKLWRKVWQGGLFKIGRLRSFIILGMIHAGYPDPGIERGSPGRLLAFH